MNIEAYNKIIDIVEPLLLQKNMKSIDSEDGSYFANENEAVKVVFNDATKNFILYIGEVAEGVSNGNWTEISKWMFADDYSLRDAESIGNDFYDTLNEKLGLKKSVTRTSDVAISGDAKTSMSLEGLLQNFLTIFPQYKDEYKAHVEKYNECLYINFFEQTAVPCLRSELRENNKKHLKKYFELLNQYYTLGDKNAQSVVSVVIIYGAIKDNEQLKTVAYSYMEDFKYLKIAMDNIFALNK